jgi:hypothetical protein
MRQYQAIVAVTPAQVADAQRLRYRVYVDEERLLVPGPACPAQNGLCIDALDADSPTAHILVYAGDQPAGTVRLTVVARALDLGGAGGESETFGGRLPFEVRGLPPVALVGVVERFCVLRRFRGTNVTPALYAGLREESRRRGVTHWLAAVNAETNCPVEAGLVYGVAAARGLVSNVITARSCGPAPSGQCTRHVYDEAQRRQAGAPGMRAALPLPRTLGLFARRLGGRYVGRPIFDHLFGVFALPLVATVS